MGKKITKNEVMAKVMGNIVRYVKSDIKLYSPWEEDRCVDLRGFLEGMVSGRLKYAQCSFRFGVDDGGQVKYATVRSKDGELTERLPDSTLREIRGIVIPYALRGIMDDIWFYFDMCDQASAAKNGIGDELAGVISQANKEWGIQVSLVRGGDKCVTGMEAKAEGLEDGARYVFSEEEFNTFNDLLFKYEAFLESRH